MRKLFVLLLVAVSFNVSAQQVECIQDSKPHYYVATGTAKTTMSPAVSAVLTAKEKAIWTSTYRTWGLVSKEHDNWHSCNEALEFLRAQTSIAPKGSIHATQSVSYEGFCLAVEVCPE